jgi:hypothetical protein
LHVRLVNDIQLVKTEEQPQGKQWEHFSMAHNLRHKFHQILLHSVAQLGTQASMAQPTCVASSIDSPGIKKLRHSRLIDDFMGVCYPIQPRSPLANQYCGDFQ